MKKIIIGLFLFLCIIFPSFSGETESETSETVATEMTESDMIDVMWDYYEEENYDNALTQIDSVITEFGENKRNMKAKMYVLFAKEDYENVLPVTLTLDKITEQRSAWTSIYITETYLHLDDQKNAFTWLDEAVNNRDFISAGYLKEEPIFDKIKDSDKFNQLVSVINENIGLGKTAKDFTVNKIDGMDFSLSDQKGKVILVDFWATWCGPCVEEMPNVIENYNTYKNEGFDIIGVSLDTDLDKLKNYLVENQVNWNISYTGDAWDDITADLYKVQSIPSTWLIDKQGILRYVDVRGEDLTLAINTLLAE